MNVDDKPLGRDDLEAVPFIDRYREEVETETRPLHNRPPIDAKRTGVKAARATFPDDPTFPYFGEPGQIDAKSNYILSACPGCGAISGMLVGHPKPASSPSWDIAAGSLEDVTTLTLTPSINCKGCCGWHGYLRNGTFESC